jgi:hypothetical protein
MNCWKWDKRERGWMNREERKIRIKKEKEKRKCVSWMREVKMNVSGWCEKCWWGDERWWDGEGLYRMVESEVEKFGQCMCIT